MPAARLFKIVRRIAGWHANRRLACVCKRDACRTGFGNELTRAFNDYKLAEAHTQRLAWEAYDWGGVHRLGCRDLGRGGERHLVITT